MQDVGFVVRVTVVLMDMVGEAVVMHPQAFVSLSAFIPDRGELALGLITALAGCAEHERVTCLPRYQVQKYTGCDTCALTVLTSAALHEEARSCNVAAFVYEMMQRQRKVMRSSKVIFAKTESNGKTIGDTIYTCIGRFEDLLLYPRAANSWETTACMKSQTRAATLNRCKVYLDSRLIKHLLAYKPIQDHNEIRVSP